MEAFRDSMNVDYFIKLAMKIAIFAIISAFGVRGSNATIESDGEPRITCVTTTTADGRRILGFKGAPDMPWQEFPCREAGTDYCNVIELGVMNLKRCKEICCLKRKTTKPPVKQATTLSTFSHKLTYQPTNYTTKYLNATATAHSTTATTRKKNISKAEQRREDKSGILSNGKDLLLVSYLNSTFILESWSFFIAMNDPTLGHTHFCY